MSRNRFYRTFLIWIICFPILGFPTLISVESKNSAKSCVTDYSLEIQGITGSNGIVPFYGVWGYSRVWDPAVTGAYINSVFVIETVSWDLVELGWVEQPNGTRNFFAVWRKYGVYNEDRWGTPSVNQNVSFKLYNSNGDKKWKYNVNGLTRRTVEMNFNKGKTGAMRERHNSCDSGWSHWWQLKRCDGVCTWSLWTTLNAYNYDVEYIPAWYLSAESTYEFYVLEQ